MFSKSRQNSKSSNSSRSSVSSVGQQNSVNTNRSLPTLTGSATSSLNGPTVSSRIYKPPSTSYVTDEQINEGRRILSLYRLAKAQAEEDRLKEQEQVLKADFQKLKQNKALYVQQKAQHDQRMQAMRKYFQLSDYLEFSQKLVTFVKTHLEPHMQNRIPLTVEKFEQIKKLLACLETTFTDENMSQQVRSDLEEMITMVDDDDVNANSNHKPQATILNRTRELTSKCDQIVENLEAKMLRISKMKVALKTEQSRT